MTPSGENGISNSFQCFLNDLHIYSVFETTIRYLGGFLSAYELTDYKYPVLLQKAQQIADKLSYAWVGVSQRSFRVGNSRPNGNRTMLFRSDT
jgi:hypothetical protein